MCSARPQPLSTNAMSMIEYFTGTIKSPENLENIVSQGRYLVYSNWSPLPGIRIRDKPVVHAKVVARTIYTVFVSDKFKSARATSEAILQRSDAQILTDSVVPGQESMKGLTKVIIDFD